MPFTQLTGCCLCYPSVTGCSTTPTPSCPDGNCLRIPHLLVGAEDSVGPCGETGFIPFEDTGLSTTLCSDINTTPVFSIVSHSEIFTNVSVNSTGITFTTTETNGFKSAGLIKYKVKCGIYSSTGTATIIIKNPCSGTACGQYQTCNKCTGVCEPIDSEVQINTSTPAISLS